MTINSRIAPDVSAEPRRRDTRVDIAADLPIRALGRTWADARLVNLSSRGFMAQTAAQFEPGSRVWLTLPGTGRVNALVVWTRGDRLGGEFAEPVDPLAVFQAAGEALGQ